MNIEKKETNNRQNNASHDFNNTDKVESKTPCWDQLSDSEKEKYKAVPMTNGVSISLDGQRALVKRLPLDKTTIAMLLKQLE